jgi:hypothetical protein
MSGGAAAAVRGGRERGMGRESALFEGKGLP